MTEKYIPDPKGYFVCKNNYLITNKELCYRYQANKLNFSNLNHYNHNCADCNVDISTAGGKTLQQFSELEQELKNHVDNSKTYTGSPSKTVFR
jgi:hypothetical protein